MRCRKWAIRPLFLLSAGRGDRGNALDSKHLEAIVAPELEALGYECVKLEVVGSSRSPVVRLYIDRPEGVTIRDCARVSRALGVLLDEADPFPGRYLLEVSSPGINRPLVTAEHFARFVGDEARVTVRRDGERTTYTGTIRSCIDGIVVLDTPDAGEVSVAVAEIETARRVVRDIPIGRPKKERKSKRARKRRHEDSQ